MRPLAQTKTCSSSRQAAIAVGRAPVVSASAVIALAAAFTSLGCGTGGAVAPPPPPPPPPAISVSISPATASILLGNSQPFSATVTGAANTNVIWSVNALAGGNAGSGTITNGGVFTAPADLPPPTAINVTATSVADPTKSATAQVTVASDLTISLAPGNANVELGATMGFRPTITSAGHPDASVRWTLSGPACPAACGAVDLGGGYTAPTTLPSTPTATLTAQSVADPAKQASAQIAITSSFALQIAAPANVPAGSTATIVATLTPVPGSAPSTVLSWALSGPGCRGATCGTLTAVTTQGSGGTVTSGTAMYTAPTTPPSPDSVTVMVTPQADPSKAAQASLAVQVSVSVSLSPPTATLAPNHRLTLTAQVFGTTNTALNWTVNGVAGGSAALGQICAVGSNPCQDVTSENITQVDYLAPGAIPQPNPVSVTATSVADSTESSSAQITIINHVLVSVQPQSITLAPLTVEGFTASVLGTSNQSVVWQIQGAACASAGACGGIDAKGNYTAPGSAPSPDAIQVVAISSDDTTQSGAANVAISTGANILTLHPASVYAGAADGFTLLVQGSGFAASSPGPGSSLLITGTPRATTCISATACSAPITAADVSIPGSVSIQIENPNGSKSNAVSLIVVAPNILDAVIPLSGSAPAAAAMDIVVVDPTTAGVSAQGSDVDLNVAALGMFSVANNSCNLSGSPIPLPRLPSGNATFDICVFSVSGLDASMTYTVTGPGDVTVIAKQPAGLGIIHLTLQVSASALPGARTLFIQNTNLDKTAATAALLIQ